MSADLIVPPHSIEAEQAVLGALMLKPDALHDIADLITEADFYRRDHKLIWRAITELENKDVPCDAVTLGDWFEHNGMGELIGGAGYLIDLANATPSAANIRGYAEVVADRHLRRQVMGIGQQLYAVAKDAASGTAAVSEAAKLVGQIKLAHTGGLVLAKQVMAEAFADLVERYQSKQEISGLSTGLKDLDTLLGGLHDEELIIIAARPSMGKTALAMNIAEAACKQHKAVALFSLEMSRKQLGNRLIASVGTVDLHGLRTPAHMPEADWPRVVNAKAIVGAWTLAIDANASMTMPMIRARCLRMHARHPLGLVVIDYLQLIEVSGNGENRANAVAEISRGLKVLASELKCPVIALSQLNRSLEQRADKRPMMSDLRESGAIEQDADVIAFIYRDEYYHRTSPDKGIAEIIVAKQRNGATDTVRVKTELQYSRFRDLDDDWTPELDIKPCGSSLPAHFRVEIPA